VRYFGFAGWSGSGKTTLIEQLVPRLVARGLVVSLIKHAHHQFDVDRPGKDSWRHRNAGCTEVLLTSSGRWALMHELRGEKEPTLAQSLARLSSCDIALVEGFRGAALPKLEIWRPSLGRPTLHDQDRWIVAVATDAPELASAEKLAGRPVLRLDDFDAIATLVLDRAAVHLS